MKPFSTAAVLLSLVFFSACEPVYNTGSYGYPQQPGYRYPNSGYGQPGYYGQGYDPYPYGTNTAPYYGGGYYDDRNDHKHPHDHPHHQNHNYPYPPYTTSPRPQPTPRSNPAPASASPAIVRPSCPPGTTFDGRHCLINDKSQIRKGGKGTVNACPKDMWLSGDKCVPNNN